jgi:hypothetical protein
MYVGNGMGPSFWGVSVWCFGGGDFDLCGEGQGKGGRCGWGGCGEMSAGVGMFYSGGGDELVL